MSPSLIGGLAGMVLGFMGFALCQVVARKIEGNAEVKDRARMAGMWRTVAYVILVLDVLVGYYIGPFVLGAQGI